LHPVPAAGLDIRPLSDCLHGDDRDDGKFRQDGEGGMMRRVYEAESGKKAELNKILEADPYADDSFARVGYKVKDGAVLGEDKSKVYLYISASDDFIKKADERLAAVAKPAPEEAAKRIIEKVLKEEEEAESGFGSIFGE